jgi:hypothetical protein
MQFKLDENIPQMTRAQLIVHGWDVHDVYDEQLAGAVDQSIQACLECLAGAMRALSVERIAGSLWIVETQRLRIRDFPSGA